MKRILKIYSDGQEEIVRIREINWPLIIGLAFTLTVWVTIIGLFA